MDTIYLDYEDSLIGRKKSIASYNFNGNDAGGNNQQRALSVIRYALETVLKWDVEESVKKFDTYMIHIMKLDKILNYISWPDGVEKGDPQYILSLIYPERVHINLQTITEETYLNVLETGCQFPRDFFSGSTGFYRFCVCFQYLMTKYHPLADIDELYQFTLSSEGNEFLFQYRLKVPAMQFDIDILQCIYTITKELPHSLLFYQYYQFQMEYRQILQK